MTFQARVLKLRGRRQRWLESEIGVGRLDFDKSSTAKHCSKVTELPEGTNGFVVGRPVAPLERVAHAELPSDQFASVGLLRSMAQARLQCLDVVLPRALDMVVKKCR
jgi:hypothetical protein